MGFFRRLGQKVKSGLKLGAKIGAIAGAVYLGVKATQGATTIQNFAESVDRSREDAQELAKQGTQAVKRVVDDTSALNVITGKTKKLVDTEKEIMKLETAVAKDRFKDASKSPYSTKDRYEARYEQQDLASQPPSRELRRQVAQSKYAMRQKRPVIDDRGVAKAVCIANCRTANPKSAKKNGYVFKRCVSKC